MPSTVKMWKSALLTALIIIGIGAQKHPAHAQAHETLTVAGGCFWCVEADFESIKGVSEVVSGFTGGNLKNPTYDQVTGGDTGHYEAVQIHYDPSQVSRSQLFHMFFRSIDPTDAGGQFCDRGSSYRSAIFVSDPAAKAEAQKAKANAQKALGQEVVTPILPKQTFYKVDEYHQDYYKSSDRLAFSSVGLGVKKSVAYKRYRKGCGRDARVKSLWGDEAPFAK